MNNAIPILSVFLAILFTMSVAMVGCSPAEDSFTDPSGTSAATGNSGHTEPSQTTDTSVAAHPTQDTPDPTTTVTDPVTPTTETAASTQGTTEATRPSVTPTQGSTSPTQSSTPATETTQPSTQGTSQPATEATEPDDGLLTYDEYLALSGKEKYEYFCSFEDPGAFAEWQNKAIAERDADKNKVDIGENGSVDLDGIVNGNK